MTFMNSPAQTQPLVTLRGTGKIFPARRAGAERVEALCPTDLSVAHGEFLTIVGPSGCGKSTLLSLIAGLQRPSSGEVQIGDTVVNDPYTDLGIVFQRDLLMQWRTALDNVLLQIEMRGIGRAALSTAPSSCWR